MSANKKVLLMGRAGAGKTSMRSIIFANYLAKDTRRLTATNNIEHSHLRFLGNLVLSLWDCGGQDMFMENYFESQREHIFRRTEVLIYVIEPRGSTVDALQTGPRSREVERDFQYFSTTAQSIRQFSPDAKVFTLIHKMDLVQLAERQAVYMYYFTELQKIGEGLDLRGFETSIWDETLFKAWSEIVCALIPNVVQLEQQLAHLCEVVEADEVVLFEKSTFLVISHHTRKEQADSHRFEKIANICKQFNLTCGKTQSNFVSLTVKNSRFSVFVERFTQNTFVMLIVTDPELSTAATLCNIDYARAHFEKSAEQMKFGATL